MEEKLNNNGNNEEIKTAAPEISPEQQELASSGFADDAEDLVDLEELLGSEEEEEEEHDFDMDKTRVMYVSRPEIHIAWMYPDTLYLHGERGNVMALTRYAQRLGMIPKVHKIDLGSGNFNPMKYDILFFGPGEISSFRSVMEDISTYTRSLAEYIAAGKVMLVTGTTVSMFGERIRRFSPDTGIGEVIDGLCIIPAVAEEREYVFGDDEDVIAQYGGYSMELIGNQVHMADYEFLENASFRRFGSVIYGHGNNGKDGMEGIVYNNSIFTNMLGPVLVGNPWLTVRMLRIAAELKGITIREADPAYELELMSFDLKRQFIDEKKEEAADE